ncbi:uncharacterized protein LOC143283485 [Babylonia areolata]|uniref:uncharacterized protein LOC143283485 n=1 Tax=Babylonia areolata TaxID=304850 RepID=UPI003FD318E6
MTSQVTLLVVTRLVAAVMTVAFVPPSTQATECKYHFSSRKKGHGTFSTPGYPQEYPVQVTCIYSFDSAGRGVRLTFDKFNLEGFSAKEKQCVFDYIDIYSVDSRGFRTVLGRYCGNTLPPPVTSPHASILIEFVSDYTKPSSGFFGRYTFLGPIVRDRWFGSWERLMGEGWGSIKNGSGGIIQSPNYPRPFHARVNCSWLVHVQPGEQVMLTLDDIDIGASPQCDASGASLHYYYGTVRPTSQPDETLCGQVRSLVASRKKEMVSPNSTVVVRFISGPNNYALSRGFRLIWTAVRYPHEGKCPQFRCEGGFECGVEGLQGNCIPLPGYCIHDDQRCNGINNCGQFDDSDERRCTREVLIMTALIAVPSLAVVTLTAAVVYCYRAKHLNKSASQNQPLTLTKHSAGGASKESFHSHRSYQHCSMMQTSFVDETCGVMGGDGAGGGLVMMPGLPIMEESPADIDDQQLQIPIPPPPDPNYRTHQKRSSYTIIKDGFDDNNASLEFISGPNNYALSRGFRLIWTAVRYPHEGKCPQFRCEGGFECGVEGLQGNCIPLPGYCIHDDQRCNGINNCGQFDDSDERRCTREVLIMTALIAVPSLAVVTLTAAVVYCYRAKHLNKSASQNQPLTLTKHSAGGASKESFHSHRSYQHCSMMQTSFVDETCGVMGGDGAGGGLVMMPGLPIMEESPADIDDQQLQIPIPPPPDPNYRTHQKRSSYTIIKDGFDDNNASLE